jgi:hypothetical protein
VTSVNWPFIMVKFCALEKKPEFGGGSIAILTVDSNLHRASDPLPSSTHSHLAISITMQGAVQAGAGQSCSALQVNTSIVRMYIARENQIVIMGMV